jgi:maltose O-acetyltransferase
MDVIIFIKKIIGPVYDFFYNLRLKMIRAVLMTFFSRVEHRQNLQVGKNSAWNWGCWINAMGGVKIGANVIIGPYCVIHSGNHNFDDLDKPIMFQGFTKKPVEIGDNCWLGASVIVLPGVRIGSGSVIGAGSVVTRNVPPNSVVVGNPARILRSRKPKR